MLYAENSADEKFGLTQIASIAMADSEINFDDDGDSWWDKIWDDTFDKDWDQFRDGCTTDDGTSGYYYYCTSGNDDTCIDSSCYEL
jgi:hypothetical protein